MDTIKGKILNIEKKMDEIEKRLNISEKKTPASNNNNIYITSSEEFGECMIEDEVNAFRFVYTKKMDEKGEYFEYTLINPTDKIKSVMCDEYGNEANVILISYTKDPAKIEDVGYEIKSQLQNPNPLNNLQNRNIIKEELDKYFFRVSDICGCNIRPVNFDQDITIQFKRKYKILPHLSIYITPFDKTENISWKIKELTLTNAIITFCFPQITGSKLTAYQHRLNKYKTPEGLTLHYSVSGILEQEDVNLLDAE